MMERLWETGCFGRRFWSAVALAVAAGWLAGFGEVWAEAERTGSVEADRMTVPEKIEAIIVPSVSWENVPLREVARTLSELSVELDPAPEKKGINIVVIDPERRNPEISLSFRNLSLKRILEFVAETAEFSLHIEEDVAVLRSAPEPAARMETDFFPLTRSMLIRISGGAYVPERELSMEPREPFGRDRERETEPGW